MILYYCYKKSQKVPYLGALKRGPREKKHRRFPEGVHKEEFH